jgi:hypothetical protein
MPLHEPDAEDPMELMGMEIWVDDPNATSTMVECFAQEFASLGYDEEEILALFANPFYGAAHNAYLALGEAPTRTIVATAVAPWAEYRRLRPPAPPIEAEEALCEHHSPSFEV